MVDRLQVTNYYDPSIVGVGKHTGEVDQGKVLIDTAKEVGVKFLVWRFVDVVILTDNNLIFL
jgi:hypothetical protein